MHRELLEAFIVRNNIEYSSIDIQSTDIQSEIRNKQFSELTAKLLTFEHNSVIALYPAERKFNLQQLNKAVSHDLKFMPHSEYVLLKMKLLKNELPDLNVEKGVYIYIDDALKVQSKVYLTDKNNQKIILIDTDDLYKLTSDKLTEITFSENIITTKEIQTPMNFKERVKALHSLPPMPETASAILKLRATPDVKIEQIVQVIEKDPILAAQIVSYANSAFFGQAGSVKSIKDAIFRVLGVDAVLNMALALSIGTTFKIPRNGPLGSKKIWQSSVYVASLMQRTAMLMPWGQRLNPGTAYLVGLLHDIGLLVLGHLFPEEYQQLNQLLEDDVNLKILNAEETIFGVTHTEIGKIVMRLWNMPDELIAVTTYHHNSEFHGEHEEYVQLLVIVESLLSQHGLARDDYVQEMPMHFLEKLNLDEEDVIIAADEVLQESQIIQELAKQMCA